MKSKVLVFLIFVLFVVGVVYVVEVYNKDGNKLDLYGKVDGLYYFFDNLVKDGD